MEKLNDKDYTGVMYNNWHFTLLIKGASKMGILVCAPLTSRTDRKKYLVKILKVLSEKNQITKCTDCFVL